MKKWSLPSEVLAALVTIIGTLMVGIILGVLEGKIGFISVLGFVAFLVLGLLLYLLYKRSGPKVTAGAGLVMLVIGFVVFAVFFRDAGKTADAALTGTPTLTSAAAQATDTAQPPAPTAAPTQPAPQPTAVPTQPPASTPISTLAATRLPTATPRPAQTAALGSSVEVLTTVAAEFFAPGPKPAALAVSDDALWVGDADQKLVYKLDKSGVPQGTFPVTLKGTIQAMTWDGEALRVAVGEYSGGQIARIDAAGGVVESFAIPYQTTGLGWDPASSTLWAAAQSDSYLLQYAADGRLLRILNIGAFGTVCAMTWAPDGFWAVSVFGDWLRYDLSGTLLRDDELPMEVFGSEMGIARDTDGAVWLAVAKQKKIYKFATRTEKMGLVPTSTPNTGGPGSSGGIPGALALPHPALDDMPGKKATVIVTNSLGGTMTLSFDYSSTHETAILQPGETWTAYLEPNSYRVFFSANAPSPVAYAGKMLMLRGYQYTWDVRPPQ